MKPQEKTTVVLSDEELLRQHTKAIVAASCQCLLGVSAIGLGITVSIIGNDFAGWPILIGLALSATSTVLIVREVKARKRIREKMEKEQNLKRKDRKQA